MKKYLFMIWIIAFGAIPANVFSFNNLSSSLQPTGFRGINWESSKYDHTYLFTMYDNVDGFETYHRELEKLSLGSAKLTEITYHFYNNKFYQAVIILKSGHDHQPLLDALLEIYGTPEKESGVYIWENKTISIRLFPEGASISYLPILNKIDHKQNNGSTH